METKSRLCLALDPDFFRLPARFRQSLDGIYEFLSVVIECTKDYVAAYKINLAFFEVWGAQGYQLLEKLFIQIPYTIYLIADGKRNDIGNSARQYAKACFENWPFDAVTVNPYLGYESVEPFLEYEEKRVYLLALTSNRGAYDFQLQRLENGQYLYQKVVEESLKWERKSELGFVVGATQAKEHLNYFVQYNEVSFLVPGFGAQGGELDSFFPLWGYPDVLFVVGRAILYPQRRGKAYEEMVRELCQRWAKKTVFSKEKKGT